MPHLSLFDRVKIVYLFNKINNGVRDKYSFISNQAKTIYQISISESGVRRLIKKWKNTNQVADRLKTNVSKCLISKAGLLAINEALLKNPFLTAKKLKCQLSLIAPLCYPVLTTSAATTGLICLVFLGGIILAFKFLI